MHSYTGCIPGRLCTSMHTALWGEDMAHGFLWNESTRAFISKSENGPWKNFEEKQCSQKFLFIDKHIWHLHPVTKGHQHFQMAKSCIIDNKIRLFSDWFQYLGSLWQHIWLVDFARHFRSHIQTRMNWCLLDKRLCLLRVPPLNVKQLWKLWFCGSIF